MRLQEFKNDNFVEAKPSNKPPITTPSQLNRQVFLMNFPLSLSTQNPNNTLMQDMSKSELKIDYNKAFEEFTSLYSFMVAQGAIVYLLPNEGEFQDQEYVANLGIYFPHLENTIALSNFTSPPRRGEEKVGQKFFEQMKYDVHMCPHKWEGEAELKYLHKNVYIGGHGLRSEMASYKWMEKKFDMVVLPLKMSDPDLYHVDTLFLRLGSEKVMMPTSVLDKNDIKNIEKHTEIIDVPVDVMGTGSFNAVMCGKYIMYADLRFFKKGGKYFNQPDTKTMKGIAEYMKVVEKETKLTPKGFDLCEFKRSGADLGCLIMHLNYRGY